MHAGLITFHLDFRSAPPPEARLIEEPNRWRSILRDRGLLGQDPSRYGGYGFGNISRRLPPWDAPRGKRRFLVTASQTGHLDVLECRHYTVVQESVPSENRIRAEGILHPSSESITHGMLYDLDDTLRYVMHVHSPVLWHAKGRLGLPVSDAGVPYGSPELAREIERLYRDANLSEWRVLAMGGHEDGLISFGRTADEAGSVLLDLLEEV